METGRTGGSSGCFAALPGRTAGLCRGLAGADLHLLECGHSEEALALQATLIENGERAPAFVYNAALLRQQAGNTKQFVGLYLQALNELPEFAEVLLNTESCLRLLTRKRKRAAGGRCAQDDRRIAARQAELRSPESWALQVQRASNVRSFGQ